LPTKERETHFFDDWERGRVLEKSRERETSFLYRLFYQHQGSVVHMSKEVDYVNSARKSEGRRGIDKICESLTRRMRVYEQECERRNYEW